MQTLDTGLTKTTDIKTALKVKSMTLLFFLPFDNTRRSHFKRVLFLIKEVGHVWSNLHVDFKKRLDKAFVWRCYMFGLISPKKNHNCFFKLQSPTNSRPKIWITFKLELLEVKTVSECRFIIFYRVR